MLYQVAGIGQRRSGTSSKSNRPYDMTALHCLGKAPDVVGNTAEEIIFNHLSGLTFPADISVGSVIDVSYDRRGFMVDIALVEKSTSGKTNMRISSANTP